MVGNFTLEEKIVEENVSVGKSFTYKIKVRGEGLIFPIEPPKQYNFGLEAKLRDIQSSDTIINDALFSDKTFTYQVIPRNEGDHDLGKIISFSFFNPTTTRKETLRSSLKIIAENGERPGHLPLKNEKLYSRNNFIAIDASQSMLIEDYLPNRLSVVKEGIKVFFQKRARCDIGIIAFAGDAHHIKPCVDTCYSDTCLDSISVLTKRGTAVGDAIWLARVSMNTEIESKKIVLIGDGDNTAGVISPQYAAELAKNNKIQIYTIGIGNNGPVPYGRDIDGRPNMIDNTFNDFYFKKISHLTGGKYYHARDPEEINKILNQIFFKINF